MQKHPAFEGFGDIRASDDLRRRLYAATAEYSVNKSKIRRERTAKRFLVVAAAILAVALVGFTNIDRIRQLYQTLFGGPVQLEEFEYNMIGESAIDQGFKLEVVSAVRDSENLYLIAELSDLEGGRLSGDLYVETGAIDGIGKYLGENVASMSGMKTDILELDEAAQTAVLGVHATGNSMSDEAVFTLNGIATGKISVNTDATEISLYELAQNSSDSFRAFDRSDFDFFGMSGGNVYRSVRSGRSAYDDIQECLVNDSMDLPIPGYNRETVSNVAYKDGMLHVLFKTLHSGLGNNAWITLRHTQTKEDLRPDYSLHYGIGEALYQEEVYSLPDPESIKDYVVHVEGVYYENTYQGDWRIRFAAPQEVASVELPVTGPVVVDGKEVTLKSVTVTPLSVVILAGEEVTHDGFDVTLAYQDGTRKPLTSSEMYTYESGEQEWHYADAFLFQEIEMVEINGVGFDFPRELVLSSYEDAAKFDMEAAPFQPDE